MHECIKDELVNAILVYSTNENLVNNGLSTTELKSPSSLELQTRSPQNIPDTAHGNSNTTIVKDAK